jgi:hypothetical protein
MILAVLSAMCSPISMGISVWCCGRWTPVSSSTFPLKPTINFAQQTSEISLPIFHQKTHRPSKPSSFSKAHSLSDYTHYIRHDTHISPISASILCQAQLLSFTAGLPTPCRPLTRRLLQALPTLRPAPRRRAKPKRVPMPGQSLPKSRTMAAMRCPDSWL